MSKQNINLYYREGSSDKLYHVQLEPVDGGFVVNFQYGRRGSTLQTGTKTPSPLPLDKAKTVYDKLVAEKKAKGYTEGTDGTPYTGTDKAGDVSGLVPQLLNPIDEDTLQSLLDHPAFLMQEKKNGKRLMIRFTRGEVVGSNRKGLIVAISSAIEAGLKELVGGGVAVLDGEAIGDIFYIFDLLELDEEDLRPLGVEERWLRLQDLFGTREGGVIRLVPMSRKPWHKRQWFAELEALRVEGVVFKRWDAPYVPGRPASGGTQLKYKFVENATCLVTGVNGSKRSVGIEVIDRATGKSIRVGNVTIPANHDIPEPNRLVEVRYLYAYPGGSLYQPVYEGPREDKNAADYLDTLKFLQEPDEEA